MALKDFESKMALVTRVGSRIGQEAVPAVAVPAAIVVASARQMRATRANGAASC